MCGRYVLKAGSEQLAERYGAEQLKLETVEARYNVAPGQVNPVVVNENGHAVIEQFKWGLIPSWSKEPKVNYSTINARAETVAEKPTYKKLLHRQRCLVPATGFYEWQARANAKDKTPYHIALQDPNQIFSFAGLFEVWHAGGDDEIKTYTVITTEANDLMRPIHERMPVILPQDKERLWLFSGDTSLDELVEMLQPYPADLMQAYPVAKTVNRVGNEGEQLIEPVEVGQLTAPLNSK